MGMESVHEIIEAPPLEGEIPFASGPPMRYGPGGVFVDPRCSGGREPVVASRSQAMLATETLDGEHLPMGNGWCDEVCQRRYSLGFEFTFLKPHFDSNPAYTLTESDGISTEISTVQEQGFNTQLAPRIWLEMLQPGSLGLRASWWQFDNSARTLDQSPPANGFGRVSSPAFGAIDLSTTVPGSNLTTDAGLRAYTFDLEGTTATHFGDWGCIASAGLRYANLEQSYRSSLTSATGLTQGTIDFRHVSRGIGPTMAARLQRPLTTRWSLFGQARGSLLYGDSFSRFEAIEDQDLDVQLTTRQNTDRDDLLPIGELMVGLQWMPARMGAWNPYLHLAMEGQFWNAAGNSSSEIGNLGFYGFNLGLGVDW